ncbi:OmpA family protein [Thiocapsa rosea]|uniref:Outer membrane protein OmpA-like peptidoglycan-associated protein n=1 Tax=Thiocapsa rosea TaxID=69360 RepID=A0A495VCT4_9GAMM|nr:OmpA family protein [Thiocapsa rosea]RKT47211.1 outer membrane protein OmpA-like peptidoglycan-associated protein [Thiocapsa rosea]
MSDRTPLRRSAWVLASIVLGVAVFAGLLLNVGRETDTPAIPVVSEETNERADLPVTRSVDVISEEADETADIPVTRSVDVVSEETNESAEIPVASAIDVVSEQTNETADIPVTSAIETPPDVIDKQADRAAMDAVLTDMQNKIQQLEDDVATLQEQRKRIDDALIRQANRSPQEPLSATTSSAPVDAVPAVDRAGLDAALAHLGALATEQGHLITLGEPELSFKADQAEFASEPPGVLEEIAKVLMRYEHMLARIEGHSDSKGDTQRNQQLTQDRAESVREALLDDGIDPDRIQAAGLGGIRPVTDNRTIAARERNRRIEIYLIEP